MPVLSPRRSSASALSGGSSYRPTFSSSTLDRPYCGSSSSYLPRINSYSERFTTRSYIDGDGRRVYSRQGSITEDGVTTRFKEEMREGSTRRESMSRDSGISSIRENSILDTPRRDSSLTRGIDRPRISAISVAESVAEMRNKYSPSNYVPACLRNNDNITRSKSINDIGKPPATNNSGGGSSSSNSNGSTLNSNEVKSNNVKLKVNGSSGFNNYTSNGLGVTNLSNNTNNGALLDDNVALDRDDNGNRASVAEIRKKFDQNLSYRGLKTENLAIEGVKISENRFKQQDNLESKPKFTRKKSDAISSSVALNNKKNEGSPTANGFLKKKPVTKLSKFDGSELSNERQQLKSNDTASKGDSLPANESKLKVSSDGRRALKQQNGHRETTVGAQNASPLLCSQATTGVEVESKSNTNVPSDNTGDSSKNHNHTTNFASYIPSKDTNGQQQDKNQGDSCTSNDQTVALPQTEQQQEEEEENSTSSEDNRSVRDGNDMENRNYFGRDDRYYQTSKDISSASPRSNRAISQNATSTGSSSPGGTSNSYQQRAINSLERDEKTFEKTRGSSPIKQLGLNGLKNIGNTCFMNSVIQCLSNTKLLLEYVKNDLYSSDINTTISGMKGALIKAFAQVIKELWSEDSSDRVVNTLSLKSQIQRFAPRFMGYAQQDAQEFLRYLLEGLHEDVNRVTTKPTPILTEIDEKLNDNEKSSEAWQRYLRMDNSKVVDIFVGQLKSTLKCTHCGHCSVTFDPFWDLSLPIPQRDGQLRLQQCLDYFTREETLDRDEKPTCSKCKERRKCTKSFTIQKFPKILVIHLKRFSPTERYRGKLSLTIDFPLEGLDMRNYAAESNPGDCRYNLYAISNHSGTTYSGHYTAYCRHPYSHAWHEYNDSRVSGISSKSLVSGEAYVLFYELENQKSHL